MRSRFLLLSIFLTTFFAHAQDYSVKRFSKDGKLLWERTISYESSGAGDYFKANSTMAQREDGAAVFVAEFHGKIHLKGLDKDTFKYSSFNFLSHFLIASFDSNGKLVTSQVIPFDAQKQTGFNRPFQLKFLSDDEVFMAPTQLQNNYISIKSYFWIFSFSTGKMSEQFLRLYGGCDLIVSDAIKMADGNLIIAGNYGKFGNQYALFLAEGGKQAIALKNGSADDDPSADVFVALLNAKGETKWAKEIWTRGAVNNSPVSLQLSQDQKISVLLEPGGKLVDFAPRTNKSRVLKTKGSCTATYTIDGNFIYASCD